MNFCAIDFGHTNYKLALIKDNNIISVQKNSYENISELNNLATVVKKFNCDDQLVIPSFVKSH